MSEAAVLESATRRLVARCAALGDQVEVATTRADIVWDRYIATLHALADIIRVRAEISRRAAVAEATPSCWGPRPPKQKPDGDRGRPW